MLKHLQTQRRADGRPPLPHQDEFPAEYSLAGCSPAEPASASSAMLILNQKSTAGYGFSANGNCPRTPLSHLTTQSRGQFQLGGKGTVPTGTIFKPKGLSSSRGFFRLTLPQEMSHLELSPFRCPPFSLSPFSLSRNRG
jgi:hypothetical protein